MCSAELILNVSDILRSLFGRKVYFARCNLNVKRPSYKLLAVAAVTSIGWWTIGLTIYFQVILVLWLRRIVTILSASFGFNNNVECIVSPDIF